MNQNDEILDRSKRMSDFLSRSSETVIERATPELQSNAASVRRNTTPDRRTTRPVGLSVSTDSVRSIDAINNMLIENRLGSATNTEIMRFSLFLTDILADSSATLPVVKMLWAEFERLDKLAPTKKKRGHYQQTKG